MAAIAYTVVATLPDEQTASEYIAWLQEGHVAEVVAAGANNGVIIRVQEPPSPIQVETRYMFANQAAFDDYIRSAAPGLRAKGLERFPASRGIRFERRVGWVV